jgi:hypothetical protein
MQFSTIIASTFAVFAAAAPAVSSSSSSAQLQERAVFDASLLNGLAFNQVDLTYLLQLNSIDLGLLQGLVQQNGLNNLLFQNVFQAQAFDVQSLVQFSQLQTLLAVAQTGVFSNGFSLAQLQLGQFDFGLINGVAGVNLGQFINAGNIQQINVIAGQVVPVTVVV